MTDGQIALLALLAFTVYECMRWLPERAWVFQALERSRWRGSPVWQTFRARGGGVALLNPLPPIRPHLVTAAWPCAPHPAGLAVWNDEKGTLTCLPWEEVHARCHDSVLHFNASHHTRCINANSAKEWARRVNGWKEQSQEEREAGFAEKAGAMLDASAITHHTEELAQITHGLRRLGSLVAICTFVLLPLAYWLRGDSLSSYMALGLLLVLMLVQAGLLLRAVRRYPALRHGAAQHVIATALFPPSSMRAADGVCAAMAMEFHPLTAHQAWSDPAKFTAEAGITWRQARWPKGSQMECPWNGPEVMALRSFFEKHQLDVATLENRPEPQEGCSQYCPRCLTQFLPVAKGCPDCTHLPLQPLKNATQPS